MPILLIIFSRKKCCQFISNFCFRSCSNYVTNLVFWWNDYFHHHFVDFINHLCKKTHILGVYRQKKIVLPSRLVKIILSIKFFDELFNKIKFLNKSYKIYIVLLVVLKLCWQCFFLYELLSTIDFVKIINMLYDQMHIVDNSMNNRELSRIRICFKTISWRTNEIQKKKRFLFAWKT